MSSKLALGHCEGSRTQSCVGMARGVTSTVYLILMEGSMIKVASSSQGPSYATQQHNTTQHSTVQYKAEREEKEREEVRGPRFFQSL